MQKNKLNQESKIAIDKQLKRIMILSNDIGINIFNNYNLQNAKNKLIILEAEIPELRNLIFSIECNEDSKVDDKPKSLSNETNIYSE